MCGCCVSVCVCVVMHENAHSMAVQCAQFRVPFIREYSPHFFFVFFLLFCFSYWRRQISRLQEFISNLWADGFALDDCLHAVQHICAVHGVCVCYVWTCARACTSARRTKWNWQYTKYIPRKRTENKRHRIKRTHAKSLCLRRRRRRKWRRSRRNREKDCNVDLFMAMQTRGSCILNLFHSSFCLNLNCLSSFIPVHADRTPRSVS